MRADDNTFYRSRVGVLALATLCCLLWGSAYPAIKNGYALLVIAPDDIASQILFAGWRFVLAGIILLGAAVAMRKPAGAIGSGPGSHRQVGQRPGSTTNVIHRCWLGKSDVDKSIRPRHYVGMISAQS